MIRDTVSNCYCITDVMSKYLRIYPLQERQGLRGPHSPRATVSDFNMLLPEIRERGKVMDLQQVLSSGAFE